MTSRTMTTKLTTNMDQQQQQQQRQEQWLVIGVSGVTCGGKTTLAGNLQRYFRENPATFASHKGIAIDKVHLISQDNYFLPVEDSRHVLIEHLNHINWEIISAIDMKRMCKDVMELLGTQFLLYPTKQMQMQQDDMDDDDVAHDDLLMHVEDNLFSEHHLAPSTSSFLTTTPTTALHHQQQQDSGNKNNKSNKKKKEGEQQQQMLNILIIEGFLIFNHTFTLDLCNIKFHLHLPYERCQERRQKRRYDPPDVLGYFEMVVWPLYDKHCREFAKRPDIMYLNGEVARDKIFNFVVEAIREQL